MRPTLVRRFATPISIPAASIARSTKSSASSSSTQPPSPSSPSPSKLRTKNREAPLSLEHFLLRSRVLNLYRTIVRAIYQIPDPDARKDPIAHAKGEFSRNRNVRDKDQIRYLVSTGKAEWDGMRRYVEELAMRAGRR